MEPPASSHAASPRLPLPDLKISQACLRRSGPHSTGQWVWEAAVGSCLGCPPLWPEFANLLFSALFARTPLFSSRFSRRSSYLGRPKHNLPLLAGAASRHAGVFMPRPAPLGHAPTPPFYYLNPLQENLSSPFGRTEVSSRFPLTWRSSCPACLFFLSWCFLRRARLLWPTLFLGEGPFSEIATAALKKRADSLELPPCPPLRLGCDPPSYRADPY